MARLVLALSIVVIALGTKPDGTCGYECTEDSQCNGCGVLGKCSCPNGQNISFFQIGCTCVSAPANPPATPAVDIEDTVWPDQFTAGVEAWCYRDFGHEAATATGKFYFDKTRGKTRADWTPYINGKAAKQVWITDMSSKPESTYYVKTGPVCISFHITDPGQNGIMVGAEKPDWMKGCKDAGVATYVGREQVEVDGNATWVDHWSCRLEYTAVNQSINFQNWNSIGLGLPKGLPVRVTGGNSAPDPQKGSPRLNTVWYKSFKVGANATTDDDFKVPNFGVCIPVGESEIKSFFGHDVKAEHTFSSDFHRRAHHLPHAKANLADLRRAKQPKPSKAFVGDDFEATMKKLNAVLTNDQALTTRSCHDLTLPELHETQRALFDARTPQLDAIYDDSKDTRRMAHRSLMELVSAHAKNEKMIHERPDLVPKTRDGLCHEAVMWYIHHLTADARQDIKQRLLLPLLPLVQHPEPDVVADATSKDTHKRYTDQVSCAICHVTPATEKPDIVVV